MERIDPYLPDPFLKPDGTRVTRPEEWPAQAAHIRALAEEHMYGRWPGKPGSVAGETLSSETVYGGAAVRERVRLTVNGRWPVNAEYIRPTAGGRHPVVVYNCSRAAMRSPYEREAVCRGYGIFSFDREMLRPDFAFARAFGYLEEAERAEYPELPCGDIMAWAWGHTVAADWLQTLPDTGSLIAAGHSRGGKAALCAGIFDERYEVTAPVGSGCGGAGTARFSGTLALDRQDPKKCETVGRMSRAFPTWMCAKYAEYGSGEGDHPITEREARFPLDAHMLRAACAPRAVFCSEGDRDFWANTFGTQLARDAAQPVFELLGVPGRNAFHLRRGGHDFNRDDWAALIDFCDIALGRERRLPDPSPCGGVFVIDLKQYAPWAE